MIPKNISMFYQDKEPITSESLLLNDIHKLNQIEERKNSENQIIQNLNPQIILNNQIQNFQNQINNFQKINQDSIIQNEEKKNKKKNKMYA